MTARLWPLAAALLLAAIPAAAQYRWIDRDGGVHYGDRPPADARSLARVGSDAPAGDPAAGLPYAVRRAMTQHPVALYAKSGACAPCDMARAFLRKRGVPYTEWLVDSADDNAEMKRRFGADSVPVLTVGRTSHTGFLEPAWAGALDLAEYPAQAVLPATYRPAAPQPLGRPAEAAAAR